ncbi:M23 family metallopeptidase [Sansalvadorimonas sp. 2012CJ34-2]|uniref:M23 family metallopeptidase n=1 Tax=Parendozoicomonas callyspongiae TaxID=2942213 RepID=A0ABT0PKH3_9GAMM|nr:M23 family metallopeptidase [Sansalvadorimonas sp. 2012CJ34-2]MCL6271859.1 M23 family metallopeptidase [Sansalvadorimonas sp. 2012CJ34-2]
MKRGILFFFLIWLVPAWAADVSEPLLTQGSLYLGQTAPDTKVFYKGEEVMTTSEGEFVLGFGRDADLDQQYETVTPGGKRQVHALKLHDRDFKIQRITGVAKKYVKPSEDHLRRVKGENKLVWQARDHETTNDDFLDGFIQPVDGPITGVYGSQRYFNGEPRRPHYGLDYAAPTGTVVVAPASGKVVLAHPNMFFSGGTMIIDHGMEVSSSFLHLSKLLVKEGAFVEQGQGVAEVGATGRVTGAHLDWRVNWGQVKLDPALVLKDFPIELPEESSAAGNE